MANQERLERLVKSVTIGLMEESAEEEGHDISNLSDEAKDQAAQSVLDIPGTREYIEKWIVELVENSFDDERGELSNCYSFLEGEPRTAIDALVESLAE